MIGCKPSAEHLTPEENTVHETVPRNCSLLNWKTHWCACAVCLWGKSNAAVVQFGVGECFLKSGIPSASSNLVWRYFREINETLIYRCQLAVIGKWNYYVQKQCISEYGMGRSVFFVCLVCRLPEGIWMPTMELGYWTRCALDLIQPSSTYILKRSIICFCLLW